MSIDSGIDDMKYGASSFNGLHSFASIGTSSGYGLIQSGSGGDPAPLISTLTHEEGHGVGMKHDKASTYIHSVFWTRKRVTSGYERCSF